MTFSDLFKVMIIQRQITWNGTSYSYTYNGRPIESRIWSIERHHVEWPRTTPTSSFKVTPFLDAEYLRNGTTYRHVIEILIGTYTRPTQQYHFEWPWVILSDLAKLFNDRKRRAVSLRQLITRTNGSWPVTYIFVCIVCLCLFNCKQD